MLENAGGMTVEGVDAVYVVQIATSFTLQKNISKAINLGEH